MPGTSVCVVGAGVAGIAAIKECVAQGLEPTCFELASDIGGTWHRKGEGEASNTPALWENLITNVSKYNMSMSDFPSNPKDPLYLSWKEVHNYLNNAVDFYGIRKRIKLNTKVIKIRKSPDYVYTGRWEVFTCSSDDKAASNGTSGQKNGFSEIPGCQRHVFDNVIVCAGFFKIPVYPPNIPMDSFKGEISHSFHFSSSEKYRGKKVLVVGKHYSAGDVVNELANVTKPAYLAVRDGTWILPRSFKGQWPMDATFSRWMIYHHNSEVLMNDMFLGMAEFHLDHEKSGLCPGQPPTRAGFCLADGLPLKIQAGEVKIYGDLVELTGNEARFRDGKVISGLDAVIFCTGYRPDLSFLDMEIIQEGNKIEMFKMTVPLDQAHNTLGFVGLIGSLTPLFSLFETQSRMLTLMMSGKLKLPSQEKMREDAEFLVSIQTPKNNVYNNVLPMHNYNLIDDIAATCGFYPSFWKVALRDPVLAWKVWFGPFMNAHFRLVGPDSRWDQARTTIYSYHGEELDSIRNLERKKLRRTDKEERNRLWAFQVVLFGGVLSLFVAGYRTFTAPA